MAKTKSVLFKSAIAGIEYALPSEEARLKIWAELAPGCEVEIKHEPTNKHDENACAVFYGKKRIGYIPRQTAKSLCETLKKSKSKKFFAIDLGYLSGGIRAATGLNIIGFID